MNTSVTAKASTSKAITKPVTADDSIFIKILEDVGKTAAYDTIAFFFGPDEAKELIKKLVNYIIMFEQPGKTGAEKATVLSGAIKDIVLVPLVDKYLGGWNPLYGTFIMPVVNWISDTIVDCLNNLGVFSHSAKPATA